MAQIKFNVPELTQVTVLDDFEEENLTKKDEIPWVVVKWQSQLVRKQLSRGLLHEEAVIAEKLIKDWLGAIEAVESNRVYEVLAAILGSSLNISEEIEFFLNQIPGQYRMTVLLSTSGDLGLDITYEQWAQRIRLSGLVGDWTSQDFVGTDAVEVMIAICNLLADCKIR